MTKYRTTNYRIPSLEQSSKSLSETKKPLVREKPMNSAKNMSNYVTQETVKRGRTKPTHLAADDASLFVGTLETPQKNKSQ